MAVLSGKGYLRHVDAIERWRNHGNHAGYVDDIAQLQHCQSHQGDRAHRSGAALPLIVCEPFAVRRRKHAEAQMASAAERSENAVPAAGL